MTDSNQSMSAFEVGFALDVEHVINKYRTKAWTKAKEDLQEIINIMDAVIRKYTQGKFSLILEETPSIQSNAQFSAEHIHFSVAMVTKPTIATHDTDWVHVGYISHFKVRHDGEYPILFQNIPVNSREELVVVAVLAFRDPKSKLISLLSANWVDDGRSRR
ncbi:MAG: hypothetical protein HQM05_15365 [Magnetococcales bacterium]|nr:hypothetical protein [Magnetococcales bacterium]